MFPRMGNDILDTQQEAYRVRLFSSNGSCASNNAGVPVTVEKLLVLPCAFWKTLA
jgi:hypothetical protein